MTTYHSGRYVVLLLAFMVLPGTSYGEAAKAPVGSIEGITIRGNQEMPRAQYIVPARPPGNPENFGTSEILESYDPQPEALERAEFKQKIQHLQQVTSQSKPGTP